MRCLLHATMTHDSCALWSMVRGLALWMVGLGLGTDPSVGGAVAWGAQFDDSSASTALDVDVTIGGPDEEALEEAIRLLVVAQIETFESDSIGGIERIGVEVGWRDEFQTIFVVAVELRRDGQVLRDSEIDCSCGTQELFQQITASIDELMSEEALRAEDVALSMSERSLPADEPRPSKTQRSLTWLGWTGIAVASAGVATGGVGIGMWSKGRQIELDPTNNAVVIARDYRPPGKALTLAGGVALGAGVLMLVLDVTRGRRRQTRVSAMAGPNEAIGAVVGGRF